MTIKTGIGLAGPDPFHAAIDTGVTVTVTHEEVILGPITDPQATAHHITYKKAPIQPTTAKLNTADGSPMSVIGTTALHLRIAEFKFTHNFIICDQLPETELIFGIDIQRKFSISYTLDKGRNCYIQREEKFLVYSNTCD